MNDPVFLDVAVLAEQVAQASIGRPRILLGIDGPGASGKSTLSELLAGHLVQAHIVHVDDFYLPTTQRGQRAGSAGALFDLPRLSAQVLDPATAGGTVRYQRYDWTDDALAEWIEIPEVVPVIVEGVYTLESSLRKAYTYTIFCRADPALRLRRGLERDGEKARSQWVDEWMPAEDDYAARQHPQDVADLLVDSSVDGDAPRFRLVQPRS